MKISTRYEIYDFDGLWSKTTSEQEAINIAHNRWKDTLIGKDDTSLSQFVKVKKIQEVSDKTFVSDFAWYQKHAVL